MQESKAISPEVKGLFDTIKSQAKEYVGAFDYLEAKKSELESLANDLRNISSHMADEVHSAIEELNRNYQDSLSLLETKSGKVLKIYNDLENIRALRDSLSVLNDTVIKQTFEMESRLQSLKHKTEVEIDATLTGLKNKLDRELEQETQRMEVRLAMKMKNLENRLLSFDQKLWNLSDVQVREFKQISNDIELIKTTCLSLKEYTDSENKIIENMLFETKEDLERKINIVDSLVNSFENDNYTKSADQTVACQNQEMDDELELLKRTNQKLVSQLTDLKEKQSKITTIFSIGLFVLFALFIVLFLIK